VRFAAAFEGKSGKLLYTAQKKVEKRKSARARHRPFSRSSSLPLVRFPRSKKKKRFFFFVSRWRRRIVVGAHQDKERESTAHTHTHNSSSSHSHRQRRHHKAADRKREKKRVSKHVPASFHPRQRIMMSDVDAPSEGFLPFCVSINFCYSSTFVWALSLRSPSFVHP